MHLAHNWTQGYMPDTAFSVGALKAIASWYRRGATDEVVWRFAKRLWPARFTPVALAPSEAPLTAGERAWLQTGTTDDVPARFDRQDTDCMHVELFLWRLQAIARGFLVRLRMRKLAASQVATLRDQLPDDLLRIIEARLVKQAAPMIAPPSEFVRGRRL